jgi:CTP:molybdopterin cytidylyltransferase MocA
VNHAFETSDMLRSIQIALATLLAVDSPAPAALFVLPGDMPAVNPTTFTQLRAHMEQTDAQVCIPQCHGRLGHPVLIRRDAFDAVLAFKSPGGLRKALTLLATQVVKTTDEGILLDADDPTVFKRLTTYLLGSQ